MTYSENFEHPGVKQQAIFMSSAGTKASY